ncbi:MAG: orotate phosphoribosyltransferase [Flavobacteriaceae bacterium]|nr:orotate phosphoribosyltransferase [Flavobacteriaceae bacterium]
MIHDSFTAKKVAEFLLQINAIKLEPKNPFTWASGWQSPIYCDNRIALSYPVVRNYLKEQMAKQIEDIYGKPEVIAGVATGAIGLGALVAEQLNLPFVYIRPKPKSHGRQNQIEGRLEPNNTVVVIEDLISTGKSSLQAVDALRSSGAQVKGMLAVFSYNFAIAKDNFKESKVELNTLSNYDYLLEQALESGLITSAEAEMLTKWRVAPQNWKP